MIHTLSQNLYTMSTLFYSTILFIIDPEPDAEAEEAARVAAEEEAARVAAEEEVVVAEVAAIRLDAGLMRAERRVEIVEIFQIVVRREAARADIGPRECVSHGCTLCEGRSREGTSGAVFSSRSRRCDAFCVLRLPARRLLAARLSLGGDASTADIGAEF